MVNTLVAVYPFYTVPDNNVMRGKKNKEEEKEGEKMQAEREREKRKSNFSYLLMIALG